MQINRNHQVVAPNKARGIEIAMQIFTFVSTFSDLCSSKATTAHFLSPDFIDFSNSLPCRVPPQNFDKYLARLQYRAEHERDGRNFTHGEKRIENVQYNRCVNFSVVFLLAKCKKINNSNHGIR